MILHALHDLYPRLREDPDYKIAPDGYSLQKITFFVEVDTAHPERSAVRDFQDRSGRTPRPKLRFVPGSAKPSGQGLNPCFLWDNTGYLLGYKKDDPKPERSRETFEASKQFHLDREAEIDDPAYSAVCRFFEEWSPEKASGHEVLEEITTGFGVFQIRGDTQFVHEKQAIKAWWASQLAAAEPEAANGLCLITGQRLPVAELHTPKIKGVKDAQGAGALIVSFNEKAYESYGKESGANAPVSEVSAAAYCKALNALLGHERHRIQIGDATTVFWTEAPTNTESVLGKWFPGTPKKDLSAQDQSRIDELEGSLRAIAHGEPVRKPLGDDPGTRFYILGLTGQAGGRIGVRYWHRSTLGEFIERLADHHAALSIERQWGDNAKHPDPEFPRPWQLLRQTARDSKDIAPTLGGALMRAILSGGPYPQALANAVVSRIRADREINYLRAAMLKAWLTRLPNRNHEPPMSLIPNHPAPAYRLGCLFAVLEKTQTDALGKINATIRDRFYSAASATPATVFPRLLRTYQHHLTKAAAELDVKYRGWKSKREKLVQNILDPLEQFPKHLDLEGQGLFALGYYQQRKALFPDDSSENAEN